MTIETYRDFWPFYLSQHADARTRAIHYAGATGFLGLVGYALLRGEAWAVPAALLVFYLPAWVAHFVIEGNRPATWRYPVWAFVSDLRMFALWLSGGLTAEMARYQGVR